MPVPLKLFVLLVTAPSAEAFERETTRVADLTANRKQLREQLTWLGWVAVVALGLFLTIHYSVELAIR